MDESVVNWREQSPKQSRRTNTLYRYYAGYSAKFVEGIISAYERPGGPVLDPWNGSGTTTVACAKRGIEATGVDLSPFMALVAKGRLLPRSDWRTVLPAVPQEWKPVDDRTEVLRTWLSPSTAARVRGLERHLWHALGGEPGTYPYDDGAGIAGPLCAVALGVALAVRRLLHTFETTNPTWIRLRVPYTERLELPAELIRSTLEDLLEDAAANAEDDQYNQDYAPSTHVVGDATQLPFPDSSFGQIITSPPYCTRLDYVVATLPELAVIGIPSSEKVAGLRANMIGGPSRNRLLGNSSMNLLPKEVCEFLERVSNHGTKAASGYYVRFYSSYFTRYAEALAELSRVTMDNGTLVLVVQDSHFKDINVELCRWSALILMTHGWDIVEHQAYDVPNPKALNPAGLKYRQSNATRESVLVCARRRTK